MKLKATVQTIDLVKFQARLKEAFERQQQAAIDALAEEIKVYALDLLNGVTKDDFGGGRPGRVPDTRDFQTQWEGEAFSPSEDKPFTVVSITLPNRAFKWVNDGTPGVEVHKTTQFPIFDYHPRTLPGTLEVSDPNSEYHWVTVQAGQHIAGIAPRHFLEQVAEKIEQKFGPRAQALGCTLTITRSDKS